MRADRARNSGRAETPPRLSLDVNGRDTEAVALTVAGCLLTVIHASVEGFPASLISLEDAQRLAEATAREVAEKVFDVTFKTTRDCMRLTVAAHGDEALAVEAYRQVQAGEVQLDDAVERLAGRTFFSGLEKYLADHPVDESTLTCCLYFARSQRGHIKIGISSAPVERIKTLSAASGSDVHHDVELLAVFQHPTRAAARQQEGALHRQFAAFRIRGEWFADNAELRSALARLVDRHAPSPQLALVAAAPAPPQIPA